MNRRNIKRGRMKNRMIRWTKIRMRRWMRMRMMAMNLGQLSRERW